MKSIIHFEFSEHLVTSQETIKVISQPLEEAARICIECLNNNGKIIFFGNGGSAADAQHLAAELVSRYKTERKGLGAISLTTDTSIITAIGNDYGFDRIFSRQLEALANPGDVIIGISTGGTSTNVLNGLKASIELNCKTIGFSGLNNDNKTRLLADFSLYVPKKTYGIVECIHQVFLHLWLDKSMDIFEWKRDDIQNMNSKEFKL